MEIDLFAYVMLKSYDGTTSYTLYQPCTNHDLTENELPSFLPLLLVPLDSSLPGVRLISALAADADDEEAVFADLRFEMAIEVVSGFTPNSLLIFSLISSAAADASSSQKSREQKGLGLAAVVADGEVDIVVCEVVDDEVEEDARTRPFSVLRRAPRFKSFRLSGFPISAFNFLCHCHQSPFESRKGNYFFKYYTLF